MTGIETLYLYGRIRGIPAKQLPEMVHHLIERLALTEYANRPAGQYSGGNKVSMAWHGLAAISNGVVIEPVIWCAFMPSFVLVPCRHFMPRLPDPVCIM